MISCQLYDYVEIACLYHYPIKFLLRDGGVIEGIALDTLRNDIAEECIKIKLTSDGTEQLLVLDSILSMQALIENPHFQLVNFELGTASSW